MFLRNLLIRLLALPLLCGCEDGKQYYTQYRATRPIRLIDADSTPIHTFRKGDVVTIYRDKDWSVFENRLIRDGKVVETDTPFNFDEMEAFETVKSGELIADKQDLSLREYWALLREVAPDKMKARNHFLWMFLVMLVLAIFAIHSLEKLGTTFYDPWQLIGGVSMILFSLTLVLYYQLNPDESLWYINDVGFWGGMIGIIGLASMIGIVAQMWTKMVWAFRRGAHLFGILALAAIGCFGWFLILLVPQLFTQCGFIIWTLVILFGLTAGGGISSLADGVTSGGGSGSDTVSDGNGNTLHVTQDLGGGRVQVGEDTYRRGADGNYRKQ